MSTQLSRRMLLKMAGIGTAGAFLAACTATTAPGAATTGSAAPAGAKSKLIFSSYTWSGYEAAMKDLIGAWNKTQPDVEVEGQFIPEDYWTKLQTQVAGGTPPDVGIADYGRLLTYAKSGILLSLDDYLQVDKFSVEKMLPAAVAQYRWQEGDFDSGGKGGKMYGLPSDAQCQIIAYNKKMFDAAGVAYPTDDWTWDNLVEAGKTITKADQNIWGMQMISPGILTKGNFLFSAGGANHSDDFKKSMLDAPESVEVFKWNWDLVYTHKIAPAPGAQAQTNPFMSGQVAMVVDGVWWISDFAAIKDFEWDIALFPKHPKTGKLTTSLESDGWWIFKNTQNPDMAWNLMKFLVDENGQKRFSDLNYVIPSSYQDVATAWYNQTPPASRPKALENILQDSAKVDYTYFDFFNTFDAYRPSIEKAYADGT
ncbi:MAG: sugar ABC transporter substrate-binding protein, partial [Chloroflexi bacterium]|nr:sugar ABC transporter substrate-binding protein [Chloroflexota bacterium]